MQTGKQNNEKGHFMRVWMTLTAAAVAVAGLCLGETPVSPKATDRSLRFLFVAPCVDEAFFGPVKKGMQDAAALLGVQCEFVGTEDVDIPAQCELVRKGIVGGYDGIAVDIIDPTGFDAVLKEARSRGVPIVVFNTDGGKDLCLRMSAVSQNLYEAGRTVGRTALDKLPQGCKVLFTQHSKGVSALDDRLAGIREILKTKDITGEVLISGTSPAQAAKVISEALQADPAIKGILTTGQADTEGAGLAVEQMRAKRNCYVAGFDLSPGILRLLKAGVIDFTIDQQPYIQGFYPVVQLTQYCRYGILPASIDAGASVIRSADADRILILSQAGYR